MADQEKKEGPEKPAAERPQEAAELKAKLEEALLSAKRWQAEFVNYQARAARDREAERKYSFEPLLRELLALLDTTRRSVDETVRAGAPQAVAEAMRLVERELLRTLVRWGVQPIENQTGAFDPNVHDAVGVVETAEHPEGTIVELVCTGYRLHDRVLRPAQVRVAKAPEPKGH